MLIAEKGELWVSLVQMLQDHPNTHASPGDVNVRSAMLRALRRWPIAFCARVSTEKIKNQLNQLYTFRSLHSKHADINITNPLTLTCKANIVTCWIRLGRVRTLMRNAAMLCFFMRSCNSNHVSWATSLQLEDPNCAVSELVSRRNTNTCSWRWMSCQKIPPFECLLSLDRFCTSQCVATSVVHLFSTPCRESFFGVPLACFTP